MVTFVIKHMSSGKFIHSHGGSENPSNDTPFVLHGDQHDRMHFIFEIIDGPWGYIKHVSSGKIAHPSGGSLFPGNGTDIVLHQNRYWGALFAFDSVNHEIVHKGGRFVHPDGGDANPGNDTRVVLHEDRHDAMKWLLVSPLNPNEEINVYGKPVLNGHWKIIYMIINPIAEHTQTLTYTVGKSQTESVKSTLEFKWETTSGLQSEESISMSSSVRSMFERVSSSTWYGEKSVTHVMKVLPGQTVVTWQYVFDVEQHGHKGVFNSNILADTSSVHEVPADPV